MTNTNDWNGLLLDLVTSTKESVSRGIDLAMEQAPDVVHQLLLWKFWDHIGSALVIAIPCALLIYVSVKYWKASWIITLRAGPCIALNFIGLIAAALLLVEIVDHLKYALEIKLAPKLYLIEYVSSLAKR